MDNPDNNPQRANPNGEAQPQNQPQQQNQQQPAVQQVQNGQVANNNFTSWVARMSRVADSISR